MSALWQLKSGYQVAYQRLDGRKLNGRGSGVQLYEAKGEYAMGRHRRETPAQSRALARKRLRRRRAGIASAITLSLLALAGGYFYADAHDILPDALPSFVTLAPLPPEPNPFPTIPGTLTVPALTSFAQQLPSSAPIPSSNTVQQLVNTLVAQPAMGPHVGVLIIDELTGEVLGEANRYAQFTPASTQKIMTGMAAFLTLDPQSRLATVVRQDGSRLILVGGGDMLLAPGEGFPDQVDDHAGMLDLARQAAAQVKLSGRTAVTLQVDDTLFGDPRIAPAVPAGEQAVFVAPVASVAVNQARVDDTKSDMARRHLDPAMAAARVFEDALAEAGIEVEGQVTRMTGTSDTVPEIARVESAPIGELTEWAMQRSDNTITEVLGRLVAIELGFPPTPQGAIDAVKLAVERAGVNLSGASLVDLSGLGRGSLLTPQNLVDLVATSVRGDPRLRELAIGLPVAGLSGTLWDRFPNGTFAIGTTRAKTGSLPGVTALAGTVVTAQDRMLLFAIVGDQTPGPGQWGARQAIDNFVEQLAAYGSTTPTITVP